jgi:hypothetical protein
MIFDLADGFTPVTMPARENIKSVGFSVLPVRYITQATTEYL